MVKRVRDVIVMLQVEDMTSQVPSVIAKLKKLQEASDIAQSMTSLHGQEVMRLDTLAVREDVATHARAVHELSVDIGKTFFYMSNFFII